MSKDKQTVAPEQEAAEVTIDARTPESAPRRRRGAMRARRRREQRRDGAALTEAELQEMQQRLASTLTSARERIAQDISATSTPAPAEPETKRRRRPGRRRYGQRDRDNAFNEVSSAVHAKASGTLRNLRFSMSTHISWNYARILWQSYLIALLVMALAFALLIGHHQSRVVGELTQSIEQQLERGGGNISSALRAGGDNLVRVIDADGVTIYNEVFFDINGSWRLKSHEGMMYILDTCSIAAGGQGYTLYIVHPLNDWLRIAITALLCMAAVDLARGLYFIARGKRINRKMLSPIAAMSETARHLNVQDMSGRINVEGTSSELRELALVINDMLDRIGSAYDGQKQFVSDASHELRTPIAVIQGYAGMLQRWGKDDAAVRDEAIAAITKEAAGMKDLVDKLLFLARHDKKTLSMKSELVDMRELTEDVLRETRMIVKDREIAQGDMQEARVLGDAAALKQALRIFTDNACKYTPPGGSITISCLHDGQGVRVSVADTGCGIPASDLRHVFDRFYRVDDSRGAVPGHGLGLSIARIIAVSHGGKIHVRSREGAGSIFTLELPGIK